MDLRSTLARALAWRWTPTVAPLAGSLTFVVLCIAIVPDHIGSTGAPSGAGTSRDKKADSTATAAENAADEPDGESTEKAPRLPRKHASPLPAQITSRTTDTVRSLFKGSDTSAAAPATPEPSEPPAGELPAPPITPPPPPGGPAPIVEIPDTPPLPPVSQVPISDEVKRLNPATPSR